MQRRVRESNPLDLCSKSFCHFAVAGRAGHPVSVDGVEGSRTPTATLRMIIREGGSVMPLVSAPASTAIAASGT